MAGLQNPILGQNLSFKIVSGQAVQILHTGGNHWITIGTNGNEVRVYDSLRSKRLPFDTKEQIASLLHCQETSFSLEYANVQVGRFVNQ